MGLDQQGIHNLVSKNLDQFYGSETTWIDPFLCLRYTEGIKYIRQNGASWLVELISSLQQSLHRELKPENYESQLWYLKKSGASSATLVLEDGNENKLFSREVRFTDFPLENFTDGKFSVWLMGGVMLLPSEY